jgi:hypothetical protein
VSHDQGVLCRVPQEGELQKKNRFAIQCNIDIDLVVRFVCLHPPCLSGIGLLVVQLKINLVSLVEFCGI